MPELPEVETIKRSLEPKLTGRRIERIEILLEKAFRGHGLDNPAAEAEGRLVQRLSRRGKYLIFHLDRRLVLVAHLRMTGRLLYVPADLPRDKHTRIVFTLDNQYELRFSDLRKFGYVIVVRERDLSSLSGLSSLGPEPLPGGLTAEEFGRILDGSGRPLKSLLLDQTKVAGVGNIYADEALFAAGINPNRAAGSLSQAEVDRLHRALSEVLQAGIKHRGTTVSDYVDGEGQAGDFQNLLQVYRRTGQPCPRCGTIIERCKIAGRSSHFCPRCQPE